MKGYTVVQHGTAQAFLDRAQPWLVQREVEHNLILSIAAQMVQSPREDAYLVTVEHEGKVTGCAFRTPPNRLSVTDMPADAVEAFVDHVESVFDHTPGVLGPEKTARLVAESMAARNDGRVEAGKKSRIYELYEVVPPAWPNGKIRLAQPSDADLLSNWLEAFGLETDHSPGDARLLTNMRIANKRVFIWDDGGPKAVALWAGVMPHGVRVGFVYTPPEERGKGYASAVTAAASQRALDNGYEFCCLYTDLSNPTSNSIYQKIGYTPVCDVADYIIS